jgi:hypothetical protein
VQPIPDEGRKGFRNRLRGSFRHRQQPIGVLLGRHVDLVRNDWAKEVQFRVAVVIVGDDNALGFIVKPEAEGDWETVIKEALGSPASVRAADVVGRLQEAFKEPYLFASDLHRDDDCPFAAGPVEMQRGTPIKGEFHLPPLSDKRLA